MKNIVLIFLLLLFGGCTLFAQQDCGATDCPGRCGRFVDNNGDGFCDHGRLSAPVVDNHQDTKDAGADSEEPSVTAASSPKSQIVTHREQMTQPRATAADVDAAADVDDNMNLNQEEAEVTQENPQTLPVKNRSPYSLILISALTLGLYAVSFILMKTNVLKKATHRKIWNVLLLITGLASCLLGFFLVIQINYNLKMDWLWTVKLYHVQFGIAMTIIAVIHILWHWNYWKSIVKK